MLNFIVTGLLCISMLLVASSCNLCLFIVSSTGILKTVACQQKTVVTTVLYGLSEELWYHVDYLLHDIACKFL